MKSVTFDSCLAAVCLMLIGAGAFAIEASDGSERYPVRKAGAVNSSGIRATFKVQAGQSIQAAVERCQPGDRIEVMPGTYKESVVIDRDNIELTGVVIDGERPTLDGEGKMNDGVLCSGHNFTVSGFDIRNYKGNGVVVSKAQNCTFRNLVSSNAGKYALYPVECDGVLVEDCVASGVWDAAIYAGQCKNVTIQNCEAYNNTIGIETENSENVLIANNSAHENSLGILVVLLPNLPSKTATNARVINNRVRDNNYPNLSPAGNIVNIVRPGTGILVNAADRTEVTKNDIVGSNSYGIALLGLEDALPNATKLDVEPNPDNNFIHGNTFAKNGEDPEKVNERFKKLGANGGDLFWSGKGKGNAWDESTDRRFPTSLPGAAAGAAGGGN